MLQTINIIFIINVMNIVIKKPYWK